MREYREELEFGIFQNGLIWFTTLSRIEKRRNGNIHLRFEHILRIVLSHQSKCQ